MKNLILILMITTSLNLMSQINCDSISKYMFELHNVERTKLNSNKRYLSLNCKKAAELHATYLEKYTLVTHTQNTITCGDKVLERPLERYNFFNKEYYLYYPDPKDTYHEKTFVWDYDGEIITYVKMTFDKNKIMSNKEISKMLINNFVESKGHYVIMAWSSGDQKDSLGNKTSIKKGYFSVKYNATENYDGTVTYQIYAVGVFETSFGMYYLKSKKLDVQYKEDYNKMF